MSIRLYNTFTAKKEEFTPIREGKVGLYVCGVTVYDHCHIGHARSAIVFDVIYRYLTAKGYDVTFVKNFTDIDDKIIKKSHLEGISWKDVAEKYIASFHEDMDALNILRPTHEPKATEHIGDMIALVAMLLEKGYAYRVSDDVYFSVESYKGYGGLSKRSLEEMMAGARVEIDERKRNPLDFALWKSSKEGEPSWPTPFGEGRPGWHIECSVMSSKYLGIPFDIHGGGKDLIFPHHENERAQSESATGTRFVNYWIHNGFVNIEREKMSKSLGNILLIKDFIKEYHPEVLRLFFLGTHYRNPVDYNEKSIEDMNNALHRLYYTVQRVSEVERIETAEPEVYGEAEELEKLFYEAMDDDFNTALALSYIFELSKMLNKLLDEGSPVDRPFIVYTYRLFTSLARMLGLLSSDLLTFGSTEKTRHLKRVGLTPEVLEKMIEERTQARKNKDYARADEIRQILSGKGIGLLDSPKGTEWRVKNLATTKGEI
ncbi:MAG: Cysteine--tRNA ligase [Syntrophorhabdus sp. PtaU1.Bin050]|nr:MAG: Cysteine--tRNA ligase [Syntrophorhabdus sp. PtaU1.Bin050]